tara:strand:+ start:285 stop:449 length:165 start_codon:yes stop_codon:yes gene_type:complete
MTIKSPCISVCELDTKTDLCLGCYRTSSEIAVWQKLNEFEKKKILKLIRKRKNA